MDTLLGTENMADIVHARDDLAANTRNSSKTSSSSPRDTTTASPVERQDQPPRTDVGTLTLHWVTAIAFFVSLFTGIRIAADALEASPLARELLGPEIVDAVLAVRRYEQRTYADADPEAVAAVCRLAFSC